MRSLTLRLDESTHAALAEVAHRRGVGPEIVAEALLSAGAGDLARAHATLGDLLARPSDVPDEEAVRIAAEEIQAMRAERHAGSRSLEELRAAQGNPGRGGSIIPAGTSDEEAERFLAVLEEMQPSRAAVGTLVPDTTVRSWRRGEADPGSGAAGAP